MYTFDTKLRKAEIAKDSKPYFSFKLEDYNPQALSHCYAVISVYAHTDTPYGDVLSDMKFRNIHKSDVKVKNLKIERWESEDYEVTEREHEDYEHIITKEEWAGFENDSEAEMMLGGKVGDTVTRKRVVKEWQETRTKWLWKEYDPRTSKGLIPQGETVKLRISFDKPFDFYNQAESSVDWIPVVTKDIEIKELSWFNSSWGARFKVTSDNTKVAEAIDNVYLDLSNAPAGFWTKVDSAGADIRVTRSDGSTEVAREVVDIDTTAETGELHFKATGLSTSADTDFYIYYDNSSATEPTASASNGSESVWSEYEFVSHDGGGTDSSGNFTPSGLGGITTGGETGKMGEATEFDGIDDRFDVGANPITGSTNRTALAWINHNGTNLNSPILSLGQNLTGERWTWKYETIVAGNTHRVEIQGSKYIFTNTFSNDTWVHLAVVLDGTTLGDHTGYINGSGESSSGASTINTDSTDFIIGDFTQDIAGAQPEWSGLLDEIRLIASALSADYISTEYNNQSSNSTFWTVGSEETETAETDTGFFNFM